MGLITQLTVAVVYLHAAMTLRRDCFLISILEIISLTYLITYSLVRQMDSCAIRSVLTPFPRSNHLPTYQIVMYCCSEAYQILTYFPQYFHSMKVNEMYQHQLNAPSHRNRLLLLEFLINANF